MPASPAMRPPAPLVRTHGLAAASLVCAVVGCGCPVLPAMLAIMFGVIAATAIQRQPEQYTGRGLALAGIVLGVLLLVLQVLGFVLLYTFGLAEDYISAVPDLAPVEAMRALGGYHPGVG